MDSTPTAAVHEESLTMMPVKRRNTTPTPEVATEGSHTSPKGEALDATGNRESKMWPFDSSVVAPHLDLANCTFTEVKPGTVAFLAITKLGVKDLTTVSYQLSSWRRKFEGWPEEDSDSDSDCYGRNRRRRRCSDDEDEGDGKKGANGKEYHSVLELGVGLHEAMHDGKRVLVLLQEGSTKLHQGSADFVPDRKIVIFAEGRDQGALLQDFVEEMIKRIPLRIPPKPVPREFKIFRWCHCSHSWDETQTQQAREMQSVILPEGMIDHVESDMAEFLSKETAAWYTRFGIPYKRSYLFHGLPGTGKTSLICALAGRFKRRVCFLAAHNPKFSDDAMKRAMERLPRNSFLIMEDIDSLFNGRRSQSRHSSLTFTGLLNTLDGIGHAKGQIVIMTTNHIERLDEALIRAGRADVWLEFKKATDWQLEELFKWFYHDMPEAAEEWAPRFREECRKKFTEGVTMAEMQQHFVDYRKLDAESCAKGVVDFDMPMRTLKHENDQKRKKQRKDRGNEDSDSDSSS